MATTWPFLDPLKKRWGQTFSNSDIPNDTPYIATLRAADAELEGIKLFMNTYDDETISDLDIVVQLCQNIHVRNIDEQPEKASAWLDDRTYSAYFPVPHSQSQPDQAQDNGRSTPPTLPNRQECNVPVGIRTTQNSDLNPVEGDISLCTGTHASRRYAPPNYRRYLLPLTAGMLYKHLKEKRFDHPMNPDADRRLIYIADPDGYDLVAIIETTPLHQHQAVKDMIAKFFSFETSLRVKITTRGQPIYRLECHLPYFALRRTQYPHKGTTKDPHRDWIDLSFLANVLPSVNDESILGINPAQISIVLCGTSEIRYTVHCFEDRNFDEDRNFGNDEFSSIGFHADQVAKGDTDANCPIWDPREYFLHVLLIRIQQVLAEWVHLVREIETGFRTFSSGRLYFAKSRSGPFVHNNIITASYWIQKMLQILSRLLQTICETNDAWDCFIKANGDVGYFSDLDTVAPATKACIERMLYDIHEAFNDLRCLQKKLLRLQDQSEKLESFLEVRLMVENNKNTELTILYICPVTVVSTFFAIPVPIMSFERNARSFVGAVVAITAILYVLRLLVGGRFRQQPWWDTISTRAKTAWQGDRTNTTTDSSGLRVIRRRRTHPWFQKAKNPDRQ